MSEVLRSQVAVQLDSISVLARAHRLAFMARLPVSEPSTVDEELWEQDIPIAFEYNAHAASLVPIADWPLWAFRRRQVRAAAIDWRPSNDDQAAIKKRLESGPLSLRSLQTRNSSKSWNWSPVKVAIQYMLWAGSLVCVRRSGWSQVIDLPARALPATVLYDEDDSTGLRELVRRSLSTLGVASLEEIADYIRAKPREISSYVEQVGATAVDLDGTKATYWVAEDSLRASKARVAHEARFVTLFDSLVWCRSRMRNLFDLDLVFEAYKPAAIRRFGYYTCPLVANGDLVGYADLGRSGQFLDVKSLTLRNRVDEVGPAVAALRHLCDVLGLVGVYLGSAIHRGPAKALLSSSDLVICDRPK